MIFKPTMYMKSIFDVDFKLVYEKGYRVLFIDLDNTLVPHDVDMPTAKSYELVKQLKALGFMIIILSNNNEARVAPFAKALNVDYIFSTKKPLSYKYKQMISKHQLEVPTILCIGDQILTDVYGANRLGLASMLVDPLVTRDMLNTKINRFFERKIYKRLSKRDLLHKGHYYYE